MRSFIPASTLILTMLLLVGCGSVQSIRLPETDDMLVTSEDIDLPYEPIGMINPYRVGFYLFGVVDINSPASDELLIDLLNKQLIAEARKLGADGIITVRYSLDHPNFFNWSTESRATGTAIKFK